MSRPSSARCPLPQRSRSAADLSLAEPKGGCPNRVSAFFIRQRSYLMGVDLYVEDEAGRCVEKVEDRQGYTIDIVSLMRDESTICLRFIDPYGDVVFNQIQLPVLIQELEQARGHITEERVAEMLRERIKAMREYNLQVGQAIPIEYELPINPFRALSLLAHLDQLLAAASRAVETHTYLKFYGD